MVNGRIVIFYDLSFETTVLVFDFCHYLPEHYYGGTNFSSLQKKLMD